ncbi:MAG: hypothetical protein JWM47_2205 [Acidimicrobiales bacterium]|nr:hypothetical protein [Acidimicrobiales bacterium]
MGSPTSTIHTTPGDAELDGLTGGFQTFDAAVLEFDIVPGTAELTFEYVFGSEEYNEYVGDIYNDVFGLYVNGVNCALVNGEPVTINTINATSNPSEYRNNSGLGIDVELDGITTVLSCTVPVTAGVPNHIKFAIADGGDRSFDSTVFLRAGSITSGAVPDAPTMVTATAGDEQATVSWAAPPDDPDDPVNAYVVTPYAGEDALPPVTFGPSATSQSINGLVNGTAYTFKVTAANGTGTSPQSSASNEVTPRPSSRTQNAFSIADLRVVEGEDAVFTVRRSGELSEGASVKFATVNGTARAGSDYAAQSLATLAFGPGEASKTVVVATSADAVVEANENFRLALSTPANALLSDASATATVNDVGSSPAAFIVGDASTTEGGVASFTVRRVGDTGETSTVQVSTANGTATEPTDYEAVPPTTLTFDPGESAETVTVATSQNATDVTRNLTFGVRLAKPTNAKLGDAAATGTIVDDEGVAVAVKANAVSVADVRVTEGDEATITISRRGDLATTSTVKVATADGTAQAPGDYTAISPTVVTFGPGETSEVLAVATTEDEVSELPDSFKVVLSAPSGNTTTEDYAGTVTLNDDDQVLPQVSVDDVVVREGGAAVFTVSRGGDTSAPASVEYSIFGISAYSGSAGTQADYSGFGPELMTFAPGQASQTVSVDTHAGATSEQVETFRIALSRPVGTVLVDVQGTATIIDTGADPGVFRVEDTSIDEGGTATVTIARDGDTSEAATITWATGPGSAVASTDYVPVPSTPEHFQPGEAVRTVTVETTQNTVDVAKNPTFTIKLSKSVAAGISDTSATITIVDDEGTPVPVRGNFVSVRDLPVAEGEGAVITVVRRGDIGSSVSVTIASSAPGPGGDHTQLAKTTLVFAPGETTKTVTVATTGDTVAELPESFGVQLSAVSANAVLEDAAALVTIVDDDLPASSSGAFSKTD